MQRQIDQRLPGDRTVALRRLPASLAFGLGRLGGRSERDQPDPSHLAAWRATHLPLPDAVGAMAQRRVAGRMRFAEVTR